MIKAALLVGYHFLKKSRPQKTDSTSFNVMPWHLDLNGHMNNASYLSLANQARLVFLAKAGVLKLLVNEKLTPVITKNEVRYQRSLKFMEHFKIQTQIQECLNDKIILEHQFLRDEELICVVVSTAKLLSANGPVDHLQLFEKHFA